MLDEIENNPELKNFKKSRDLIRKRNILKPLGLSGWDLPLSKVTGSIFQHMQPYSRLDDDDYEIESNYRSPDGEKSSPNRIVEDVRISTLPYYQRRIILAYASLPERLFFPFNDRSKKTTSTTAIPTPTPLFSSTPITLNSEASSITKKEENEHNKNKTIKLHTDYFANKLSTLYNADAITIGRNIFFSSGKMNLSSPKGLALFAHELVHVKQQADDPTLVGNDIGDSRRGTLESKAKEIERNVLEYFEKKYSALHSKKNHDREPQAGRDLSLMNRFPPRFDFMTHSPFLALESLRILPHPSRTDYQKLTSKDIAFRTYEDLATSTIAEKEYPQTTTFNISAPNSTTNHSSSIDSLNDILATGSMYSRKRTGSNELTFVSPSASPWILQQNGSENRQSPFPFTAESGRSVESGVISPASPYSTNAATSPTPDQMATALQAYLTLNGDLLAERVFGIIQDKIKMQRNLMGFR
jgi:hypothetical protein